jgi:hypothetical protein
VTEPPADAIRKLVFPLEVNRTTYQREGLGVTLKVDSWRAIINLMPRPMNWCTTASRR